MTMYYFDSNVAKEFGIAAAVLFQNIAFWIKKNEANKQKANFHNNRYWTYNSINAFIELFPFLTRYTIEKSLKLLCEKKMILIDEFNKEPFDHTQWYALGELGQKVVEAQSKSTIPRNQEIDCLKSRNRLLENEKPIPYNKHTDNNKELINNINIINNQESAENDAFSEFDIAFNDTAKKLREDPEVAYNLKAYKIRDVDALLSAFKKHIAKNFKTGEFVSQNYMRNRSWLFKTMAKGVLDLSEATGIRLGVGEMINEDGKRYYINEWTQKAIIVPDDAPPRPSKNHIWSQSGGNWITI